MDKTAVEEKGKEEASDSGAEYEDLMKKIGETETDAKPVRRGKLEAKGEVTEVYAEGEYNAGMAYDIMVA